jgi:putative hydrolase of the HAD superfamily
MRAVLFDVDFTLVKPGPDLGPEGYVRLGRRYGLELDQNRYSEARQAAVQNVERHPELRHDEEMWFTFTELIIRGMGGDGPTARELAIEMTRLWERSENFDLYPDALPAIEQLRRHGLKIGLISNGGRELHELVAHHALDVDCAIGSRSHGWTKPHPTIFRAALDVLGIQAAEAVMVGDSVEDDIEGAIAVGMRAFLIDREDRYPEAPNRLRDLWQLLSALGLDP